MAREPLLLLPGTLCDGRVWAPQQAALADACDGVSVGDLTQDDSIEGMADRVLAAAPPRFALAGLSMGGIVAIEIWRRAPQRVLRLALLDTNALADDDARRRARIGFMRRAQRGGLEQLVRAELKPRYLAAASRAQPGLLDTVMAMARDLGPEVFLRQSRALLGRRDCRPGLPGIRCPVLVLCGERDELCPADHHRELASLIPGAHLEVLEDCGHLSTLEQPEAVAAALREWLGRAADGTPAEPAGAPGLRRAPNDP